MNKRVVFWVIFGLAILTSAWLRIGIPYGDIMGDTIRFPSVDAYYYLSAADYTYENWPEVEHFNSMLSWPDGVGVGLRPLNGWLIATTAKFFGLNIDIVGAYSPAILGVLILVPVLFIGWVLWNRWVGLIGVGLLAVIQGEFLGRTSLGFCDHHALEIFLATMTILMLLLALKRRWQWAFGAGIFLGLYYLNWSGAPLITIIILLFLGIQAIWTHWAGQSVKKLCVVVFTTLFVSCAVFMPFRHSELTYMLFLSLAVLVPIAIYAISVITSRYKPYWYPVGLVAVAVLGYWLLTLVFADTIKSGFIELSGLAGLVGKSGYGLERTISEVQPLFAPYGKFTMSLMWGGYGLVFFAGIIGMLLLLWRNRDHSGTLLIIVWSLAMIIVTLMQRRFGYYLAINLCLLSGYAWYVAMSAIGWRKYTKKETKRKNVSQWYFSKTIIVIGALLILASMIIPNYTLSSREAKYHPYAIPPAWLEATEWIRTETPVTSYTAKVADDGESIVVTSINTESDYGVLSWWDYGYWILRLGERPVPCHPGGGSSDKSAQFFVAQTTAEADAIIDKLECRYVIIDYQMVTSKFYAMPILAEVKGFTDANYNDSMICRLYYSANGITGYREVFGSTDQYKGESRVKIYEHY